MRQTAPHQVGWGESAIFSISADMEVASQTKWLTFQTQGMPRQWGRGWDWTWSPTQGLREEEVILKWS